MYGIYFCITIPAAILISLGLLIPVGHKLLRHKTISYILLLPLWGVLAFGFTAVVISFLNAHDLYAYYVQTSTPAIVTQIESNKSALYIESMRRSLLPEDQDGKVCYSAREICQFVNQLEMHPAIDGWKSRAGNDIVVISVATAAASMAVGGVWLLVATLKNKLRPVSC